MRTNLFIIISACVSFATAYDANADSKITQESVRIAHAKYLEYLADGEDDKALAKINEVIRLQPVAVFYRDRADIEVTLKRYKESLADITKSIQLNPGDAESYHSRGRVYALMGKAVEAKKDYATAIGLRPGNRVFRTDRAKLYESTGDYTDAITDLTQAISTTEKQNRSKSYEARGRCFFKINEFQKSVDDFTAAISTAYGRSILFRLRSDSYKRMGKIDLAKKDLKLADDMDEDFAPPEHLGKEK